MARRVRTLLLAAVSVDISGMMGKPVGQAQGEVNGMYERINKMCELAPSVLADEGLPKEGFVRGEPAARRCRRRQRRAEP